MSSRFHLGRAAHRARGCQHRGAGMPRDWPRHSGPATASSSPLVPRSHAPPWSSAGPPARAPQPYCGGCCCTVMLAGGCLVIHRGRPLHASLGPADQPSAARHARWAPTHALPGATRPGESAGDEQQPARCAKHKRAVNRGRPPEPARSGSPGREATTGGAASALPERVGWLCSVRHCGVRSRRSLVS